MTQHVAERTLVDGVKVLGSLSPSRAGDFMSCPLLYRFRTIDKLPEPSSPAAVRGTVSRDLIRLGGEDVELEAKLGGYETFDLLELESLMLRASTGQEVRLVDVARIEERPALSTIARENQRYQRTVRYEFRGPQKLADRIRKQIVSETISISMTATPRRRGSAPSASW